jgi:hypothetical protein
MRRITVVTSVLLVVIGLAIIVRALLDDSASPAFRVVVGLLFVAAGAGRLYVQRAT